MPRRTPAKIAKGLTAAKINYLRAIALRPRTPITSLQGAAIVDSLVEDGLASWADDGFHTDGLTRLGRAVAKEFDKRERGKGTKRNPARLRALTKI